MVSMDAISEFSRQIHHPWQVPVVPNAYKTYTDLVPLLSTVIGDPDAEADYTHLDDFANFLVATLLEPAKSENQYLNIVSDTISQSRIAQLLEQYGGKTVELEVQGEEAMHRVLEDPSKAPKEHTQSAFPVDFWYLVKGTQGKGEFVRPKSQIHNGLFEGFGVTPFEGYFKQRFGRNERL
jgi:hypothetical protein